MEMAQEIGILNPFDQTEADCVIGPTDVLLFPLKYPVEEDLECLFPSENLSITTKIPNQLAISFAKTDKTKSVDSPSVDGIHRLKKGATLSLELQGFPDTLKSYTLETWIEFRDSTCDLDVEVSPFKRQGLKSLEDLSVFKISSPKRVTAFCRGQAGKGKPIVSKIQGVQSEDKIQIKFCAVSSEFKKGGGWTLQCRLKDDYGESHAVGKADLAVLTHIRGKKRNQLMDHSDPCLYDNPNFTGRKRRKESIGSDSPSSTGSRSPASYTSGSANNLEDYDSLSYDDITNQIKYHSDNVSHCDSMIKRFIQSREMHHQKMMMCVDRLSRKH